MASKKYYTNNAGEMTLKPATQTSAGAANGGDILALDDTGRISPTVLPIGVGPDFTTATAFEAISAGKYVNIFIDAGVAKVRLADRTNGRAADGWLKESVLVGAVATIFFEGPNENVTGKTIGARQYLGTAGDSTETPLASTATGIHQYLGKAVSATSVNTDIDDYAVFM